MRVAVIGAGIAGMSCAWALSKQHDVVLFEKQSQIGGHSRTIDVSVDNRSIPVDTGFIVFNRPNYPNLLALFEHFKVPFVKSSMSFGVSLNAGAFEYGSGGVKGFLGQLSNCFRPRFWKMFRDILRFNRSAKDVADERMTLGELLDEMNMCGDFRTRYLLPMAASIWSTPREKMLDYPAKTFLNFFENHGLLTLFDQPQWYTVNGGSREYVKRLMSDFEGEVRLSAEIKAVVRNENSVSIQFADNRKEEFDSIVFACHADQTKALIEDLAPLEKEILEHFKFQTNRVFTHQDTAFMPTRKQCWSSWVYLESGGAGEGVSLSYWMNNLQPLAVPDPVVVTLNPDKQPAQDAVFDSWQTEHPLFDRAAVDAQTKLDALQGKNGTYYCGAWTGYGFHEDGLRSGLDVAEKLGARIPWRTQSA